MDPGLIYGRGISFPLHVGADGRIAWSSAAENIREAIRVILMTEPGERLQLPEFGSRLRALLAEPNTVATRRLAQQTILQALQRWEPRIEVQSVAVDADADDPRQAIATIVYRLIADRVTDRIAVLLPLDGTV